MLGWRFPARFDRFCLRSLPIGRISVPKGYAPRVALPAADEICATGRRSLMGRRFFYASAKAIASQTASKASRIEAWRFLYSRAGISTS